MTTTQATTKTTTQTQNPAENQTSAEPEGDPDGGDPVCDHPGCTGPGLYRAPKSRQTLRDYYHFCLMHVRDYNAGWNFYAGMGEDEIAREARGDTVWHRPTWPFGSGRSQAFVRAAASFTDEVAGGARAGCRRPPPRTPPLPPGAARAAAVLGLSPPISRDALRRRYKILVKRHHPDTNGGDPGAEERLKSINQAYACLSHHLSARG